MLIHDPMICRLGRRSPKRYRATLQLSRYLFPALPAPPVSRVWSGAVTGPWGLMLNDQEGDCTIAGRGHQHLLRTALAGNPQCPTDAQIQADYVAVTGLEGAAFDPATQANDNGCALEDVLNYQKKRGDIGAFASVNPLDLDHVRFTIDAFESAYCGVALPNTCQNQTEWDVVDPKLQGDSAPGSWGGHCIPLVDYDADTFTCVTWGGLTKLTVAWWLAYANPSAAEGECYAVISNELLNGKKAVPSGFDLATLQADLALLAA